jgi:hypothetical protein
MTWNPPPEKDRPDRYTCLGRIAVEPEYFVWTECVWDGDDHVWYSNLNDCDIDEPVAFAPLPDEAAARVEELEAVRQSLDDLTSLRSGWDGGRSGPVSVECARFASTLIERLRAVGVRTPQIVPLSGGDLQLEWSQNNLEVEVRITKKPEETP